MYVGDVARAYIILMNYMKKNQKQKLFIYNVGSEENFKVLNLVKKINKILNLKNLDPIILNNSKSKSKTKN